MSKAIIQAKFGGKRVGSGENSTISNTAKLETLAKDFYNQKGNTQEVSLAKDKSMDR